MTREMVFEIGDGVMLTAIVGVLVFAISYASFFNWRKTSAGRSLMYFVLSLAAWAVQSYFSRLDSEYWGREYFRLIVYIFITSAVWRMVWTLWSNWRRSDFDLQIREKKEQQNGY